MSSFIRSKEEQQHMKIFGLELGEKYRFLLDEVEETLASIEQSDKEVLLSQIQILKFELDVVIYVVKCEDGCYFGIDQNYSAVCITPSKEVRNSSSSSNQLSRRLDDDFSVEDSYLYEKLNKAREQIPALKIEKVNIPSPDEGKIAVFYNVAVDTIKTSSLSTSDLNMFLFSFSFNSSKKIVGLTDQLNGIFPDRYKEPMNELIESVKLSSSKFQEVTCFLRNNC